MKKIRLFFLLILTIFACNDDDIFKEQEIEPIMVVDGWIEPGEYPYVIITYTTPYFNIIDSAMFRDLVLQAIKPKLTISDGENEYVFSFTKDTNYFPPYLFWCTDIKGEAGKTYTIRALRIIGEDTVTYKYIYDTVITATTTIPKPPEIDSVWFETEQGSDSLGILKLQFTDDTTEKNYYRILYQNRLANSQFVPILSSNIDDKNFKNSVNTYPLFKGGISILMEPEDIYFKVGEVIRVKLCTVNEEAFRFWNAYQMESLNAINPFASSNSNLKGNVKGNGMGIFSGQSPVYQTIYIK